jgi:hypothetical protein
MRRMIPPLAGLAVCLVLLAAARGETTPDPDTAIVTARRPALHIESAALGNGPHSCDVTEIVRATCEARQSCEIEVDRNLCRTEAPRGLIQGLTIGYTCRLGELARSATAEEPHRLRLACAANRAPSDRE